MRWPLACRCEWNQAWGRREKPTGSERGADGLDVLVSELRTTGEEGGASGRVDGEVISAGTRGVMVRKGAGQGRDYLTNAAVWSVGSV